MERKGKIDIVKEFEFEGVRLGQKVKIGHWADKEEIIIGVDTEDGYFILTNSGSNNKCGVTLKEKLEKDGMTSVKILEKYENIDAFEWVWADKDDFTVIEDK